MDRAVLRAYGWSDIDVPPFCPATDDDKKRLEKFENEVVDRLFVLNAKRAEEEADRASSGGQGRRKRARRTTKHSDGKEPLFDKLKS